MVSEGAASSKPVCLSIKVDAVAHYFFCLSIIISVFVMLVFGTSAISITIKATVHGDSSKATLIAVLAIIAVYIVFLVVAKLLSQRYADSLIYRLEGKTLCVDAGFIILSRKAIPLDRITDMNLTRGPLMAMCGIWSIQIQTAGSQWPEATLYGLEDPEKVRDLLIAARDSAAAVSPPGH